MSNKLIICDFDGTLFDTNPANHQSYNEALSNFGFSISYDYYIEKCDGKSYKEFLPGIIGSYDTALIESIHELKRLCYRKYYNLIAINNDLFNILSDHKRNCKIAIVSTASKKSIEEILSVFSVADYFNFIVAKEDVSHVKSDPEGFLSAMNIANATPSTTIIYEDGPIGLRAAKASGAKVIPVKTFAHYQPALAI